MGKKQSCVKKKRWFKSSVLPEMSTLVALTISRVILGIAMMGVTISMKLFVDIASKESIYSIRQVTIFAVLVILVVGINEIISSILQSRAVCRIEKNMRNSFLDQLLNVPLLEYTKTHTSAYMTNLTIDIQNLSEIIPNQIIGNIILELLMCVLSIIFMLSLSWKMAVLFLFLVPLLMFCMIKFAPVIEKHKRSVLDCEENTRKNMQETLEQNTLCRIYQLKSIRKSKLNALYKEKQKETYRLGMLTGFLSFLNDFMGIGLFVIAMGYGTYLVSKGEVTVGSLIAMINLVSYLYGPFIHLSGWISSISSAKVSMERIQDIIKIQTEEISFDTALERVTKLELNNVTFAYKEGETILDNVNVSFEKGKLIAVSGESGAGKSTLLKVLMGLYRPNKGTISVVRGSKGKNEETYLSYGDISFVPNDNGVFSDSFVNNIIMDKDFDEQRYDLALKFANLERTYSNKSRNDNLMVSGEGNNLSSGQLQRICIARAFYRDASVWILDEPTSNLDSESIDIVMNNLREMSANIICLIVTHNKDVINQCDEHYILSKHTLIEEVED